MTASTPAPRLRSPAWLLCLALRSRLQAELRALRSGPGLSA
ncbi:hypothetical protein [Nonomuraea sp. NPDC003214]